MEIPARVGLLQLPTTLGELDGWAAEYGLTKIEGERRFAQYAVLRAVAESRELSEALSFKGGNALDLVWHPNRSTQDLDFSLTDPGPPIDEFRHQLATALDATAALLGLGLRLQRLRRNPPGPGHDWATFEGTVGFAFPWNPREIAKLRRGEAAASVVPVEISCNEVVGARNPTAIGGRFPLHVCTLEDIVAEKLGRFSSSGSATEPGLRTSSISPSWSRPIPDSIGTGSASSCCRRHALGISRSPAMRFTTRSFVIVPRSITKASARPSDETAAFSNSKRRCATCWPSSTSFTSDRGSTSRG